MFWQMDLTAQQLSDQLQRLKDQPLAFLWGASGKLIFSCALKSDEFLAVACSERINNIIREHYQKSPFQKNLIGEECGMREVPGTPLFLTLMGFYLCLQGIENKDKYATALSNPMFNRAAEYGCFAAAQLMQRAGLKQLKSMCDGKVDENFNPMGFYEKFLGFARANGTVGYLLLAEISFWMAKYHNSVAQNATQSSLFQQMMVQHLETARLLQPKCTESIYNAFGDSGVAEFSLFKRHGLSGNLGLAISKIAKQLNLDDTLVTIAKGQAQAESQYFLQRQQVSQPSLSV